MEITILNLKRLKRDLYRLYSNRTKWGINATICHYPIPYNLLKSPEGIQNPVLGADPNHAQLRAQIGALDLRQRSFYGLVQSLKHPTSAMGIWPWPSLA